MSETSLLPISISKGFQCCPVLPIYLADSDQSLQWINRQRCASFVKSRCKHPVNIPNSVLLILLTVSHKYGLSVVHTCNPGAGVASEKNAITIPSHGHCVETYIPQPRKHNALPLFSMRNHSVRYSDEGMDGAEGGEKTSLRQSVPLGVVDGELKGANSRGQRGGRERA